MVKKFIAGILKKKEDKEEKQDTDEVPDELPPLAEDVIKKTEKAPEELPSVSEKTAEPKEAVPDELPPVSNPEEIEFPNVNENPAPAELPSVSKIKEEPKAEKAIEEPAKTKESIDVKKLSFFSNVLKHVQDKGAREKLLSGDLFSRMTAYWDLRKQEIQTGAALSDEQKLEQNLFKRLSELEDLENKWQAQKMALESDLKFLHERELSIQLKISELAKILNELKLYKNVPPEKYFCLYNGVIIKNLRELIDALEITDEETFNHHANNEKNDFSSWIREVIKDPILADKLNKAKTREDMISILETEPVHEKEKKLKIPKLKPDEYFHLSNGVVIRSLYELSDALKVIDGKTFKYHVTDEKNDFRNWVKDVFQNEYLVNALSKIKTRREMINLLEAFL